MAEQDGLEIADMLDEALCSDAEMTFEDARKFVAANVGSVPDKDKLRLYGLYKQATEGPCKTGKPLFDFKGRAKWDAWKTVEHVPAEEAMVQYADLLTELCPGWEGDPKPTGGVGGPVTSSLAAGMDDAPPETLHDWVTKGDISKVAELLAATDVNSRDEEGCTALHFAADRGSLAMVELLIKHGADLNAQDVDGSTPLHYAALCGQQEVCASLLAMGADAAVTDSSGDTAKSVGPKDWTCWG